MGIQTAFVLVLAVYLVQSSPVNDEFEANLEKERALYPRYVEFPGPEGEPVAADLHEPVDHSVLDDTARNPRRNAYWLYTRSNSRYQTLTFGDERSVRNSNFDANKETIIIAHGWINSGNSEPNPTVRKAFLDQKDVNVITVDWRRLARSGYVTAASGVPAVGEAVGHFVNWLHTAFGLRYENVHLIGFSLGAHLVGNAGRATGGRVARVTGLDPAGPLWNYNRKRLSATDGVYVEAIHTDGGYTMGGLGIGSAIAQVDFFPNGGISQPGCMTNVCNHNHAWALFAATVTHNHLQGNRCSNGLQITLNNCRGELLSMGNSDLRKTGNRGSYRLDTKRRYPY
ncbi:pancreatic triacylglycerol lipase [Plutella xylostella]|uniref:pancreatic triacylglycerol lipase n=1 Tax=Plutella xylostella TaxID=51655 RepID=UPI002032F758|nr:pancreatic triacylglycerol lipase [Plutella xylostella]